MGVAFFFFLPDTGSYGRGVQSCVSPTEPSAATVASRQAQATANSCAESRLRAEVKRRSGDHTLQTFLQMFIESSSASHFFTQGVTIRLLGALITIRNAPPPYGGPAFPKAYFNSVND